MKTIELCLSINASTKMNHKGRDHLKTCIQESVYRIDHTSYFIQTKKKDFVSKMPSKLLRREC